MKTGPLQCTEIGLDPSYAIVSHFCVQMFVIFLLTLLL